MEVKYKQLFKELCEEFKDIFLVDFTDIGCTALVTMDIDTGDSPSISQKLYTLPLKHSTCNN